MCAVTEASKAFVTRQDAIIRSNRRFRHAAPRLTEVARSRSTEVAGRSKNMQDCFHFLRRHILHTRSVKFQLSEPGGNTVYFKTRANTNMNVVQAAYCQQVGCTPETTRFLFHGNRLLPSDTPEEMCLMDGDTIDAVGIQVGMIGHFADYDSSPGIDFLRANTKPTIPTNFLAPRLLSTHIAPFLYRKTNDAMRVDTWASVL